MIVFAGTMDRSYTLAQSMLVHLAHLSITIKQIERITRGIGCERVAERDAEVAAFQDLPLVEKFKAPQGVQAPDLAVVMVDGGRLQIRERTLQSLPNPAADAPDAAGPAQGLASGAAGPAADQEWEEEVKKKHWREDKIGLLLSMQSEVSKEDPCPEVPPGLLDSVRISDLVRELGKSVSTVEAEPSEEVAPASGSGASAASPDRAEEEPSYDAPEVKGRKVIASRRPWPLFAPILAAAAWTLGLQEAARKAFVGDGSKNNWTLHKRFFGSFVAIVDLIHAVSYVYRGALAGRPAAEGWACYKEWVDWMWKGQVCQVIEALDKRQMELGQPEKDAPDSSPAKVVEQVRRYLENNKERMKYDEYRKAGLPLTSSLMESGVKQINGRVKGTEKFWCEEGAEAILQMRADHLSDEGTMDDFWQHKQDKATGQRLYRRAG